MVSSPVRSHSFRIVAIDGGAASGKSSTARLIAEKCNFLHVDTGAHYRAVAYACLEAGITPENSPRMHGFLESLRLKSRIVGRQSFVCLEGGIHLDQNLLRGEKVNRTVSLYAALPIVREAVKSYQRKQVEVAAEAGLDGIVMEGRDIGTVILPDADLKVFLVADPSKRQQRRTLEGGVDAIAERDLKDSSRSVAPLCPSPDAVVIDNSDLSLEAVADRVLALLA